MKSDDQWVTTRLDVLGNYDIGFDPVLSDPLIGGGVNVPVIEAVLCVTGTHFCLLGYDSRATFGVTYGR